MRRGVLLAPVLAVAAAAAGGVYWRTTHPPPSAPAGPPAPDPVAVETVAVATGSIEDAFIAYGSLESIAKVTIAAQAAGYISKIMFTEGATVAKGTPLVQLDDKMDRAQLEAARTQARVDEANLTRTRELVRRGANSTSQLDQAVATAAASRATVEVRQTQLELLTLTAPIAGTLGTKQRDLGDYVNPGDPIVRLDDRSVLLVELRVPERLLPSLGRNRGFTATVGRADAAPIHGVIDYVDPAVDRDTRTILVRGRVDNPDGRLVPGLFLNVRLALDRREDVVLVPEEAVVGQLAGEFVFRIRNGAAERVKVEVGIRSDGKAEIRGGLAIGDEIVVRGQFKLDDGTPVTVVVTQGVG
jgi:membrane fusion protein (multidrug efflux system)